MPNMTLARVFERRKRRMKGKKIITKRTNESREMCGHLWIAYKCVAIRTIYSSLTKINDFIRLTLLLHLFALAIVCKESTCWRLNDLSPREKLCLTYTRKYLVCFMELCMRLCVCVCVLVWGSNMCMSHDAIRYNNTRILLYSKSLSPSISMFTALSRSLGTLATLHHKIKLKTSNNGRW